MFAIFQRFLPGRIVKTPKPGPTLSLSACTSVLLSNFLPSLIVF